MKRVIAIATRKDILRRSIIVGIVVGTILNLINQGDALLGMGDFNLAKGLLTYMVPFCVATYGAVTAVLAYES